MNDLDELVLSLERAGLVVSAPQASLKGWAVLSVFSGKHVVSEDKPVVYDEVGYLRSEPGRWGLAFCNATPGPGPECFEHWVASLQDLVAMTTRFFLDDPQLMEGWFVPLHRHPEWQESQVRRTILQAQTLSADAWVEVYRQALAQSRHLHAESDAHRNSKSRVVAWEAWFACQFVPLEPELTDSGEILWMRRNLQDAFRVRTRCPACQQETVIRSEWRSWVRARAIFICQTCQRQLLRPDPILG